MNARGYRDAALYIALACGCAAGCASPLPAEPHVALQIDTNALLPSASSLTAARARTAIFDTLEVTPIASNGEPLRSRARSTDLNAAMFPLSLAVLPLDPYARPRLQIALFRRAHLQGFFPIDVTDLVVRVRLPAAGMRSEVTASVFLDTDRTGLHDGWDQPFDAAPLEELPSRVGAWWGLRVLPCSTDPGPGEVCIPGGAFWMGAPYMRDNTDLDDADRERLVVLSPFFLDEHEVTVEEFRSEADALSALGFELPPLFSGGVDGKAENDFATFTPAAQPDDRSALPVNGVAWSTAETYCVRKGKMLPTEAQFEYVASGLGRDWKYPWGVDEPSCGDAVVERAGVGVYAQYAGSCRAPATAGGPEPAGRGARDRVTVGGGSVVDLAGNLSEWTYDHFAEQAGPDVLLGPATDPIECGGDPATRVVKGGSWRGTLVEALAAARAHAIDSYPAPAPSLEIGFRCAHSAEMKKCP